MELPLQVTFRNMKPSEAIEANIRNRAAKLERYYDRIVSCRVLVDADHRHRNKGNLFHVRIEIGTPGGQLVASREPHLHHSHTDAYVAVRDAFNAIQRQLEGFARQRQRRRRVKNHVPPPHGRISELVPDEGYGRIVAADGRDIYFNRNSVVNAEFDKLAVGTEVRFAEESGDLGPQASTVAVVGKHHIVERTFEIEPPPEYPTQE
jgi:ribosomal subunit interface protein